MRPKEWSQEYFFLVSETPIGNDGSLVDKEPVLEKEGAAQRGFAATDEIAFSRRQYVFHRSFVS